MPHPTPESFRKDLESLGQQLQTLRHDLRERNLLSEAHQAIMERMQRDKERLAAKLADADSKRANWDLMKAEFRGAWNSFVADLELLKLRLLDSQSAQKRNSTAGSEASARSSQV